jgi:Domain of unknown function (DUF4920)
MKNLSLSLGLLALAVATAAAPRTFGKKLEGLPVVSVADILAEPQAGKRVRIEGTIAAVCRHKGCWLELQQKGRSVHVTFEGYSFFVPIDSGGKTVALEGRVVVREPSSDEVKHKELEGATVAADRVSVEATGVEIR